MAVVRARSAPPYGLFAAVAVAVICAGAAIMFYVMWSQQSADLEKAQSDRAKLANDSELRSVVPGLMAGVGPNERTTALAQADKRIKALDATLTELKQELSRTTADRDQKAQDLVRANANAKAAGDRLSATEKDTQATSASSQTTIAGLQDQLKTLQASLTAANTARDQSVTEGEGKLNDAQRKAEQSARDNVLLLEEAKSTIARLESEVRDLRIAVGNNRTGTAKDNVGEPDGKIIRVNHASGDVWITLTSADRIKPGMTFTAYDPRMGVRNGSDEAALGNGSLEVLEVGERSTLCRITRTTPNRSIQADDVISNLVYHVDKTRKYKFVIFGDFDLDGDNIATASERDRLARLIVSWGGEVQDAVTSQTDYLVLGNRPATPATVESADPTATAPGSVAAARTEVVGRYDDLEVSAKRLGIPVLNANRFLAMIGYYSTTVVRY